MSINSVIRFVNDQGETLLGEPIDQSIDQSNESITDLKHGSKVRVVTGDIHDPSSLKLTSNIQSIKQFLPPINPSMILCVGLNYRRHAVEANLPIPAHPVLFAKNIAASSGHEHPITVPKICQATHEMDFEAELGIVIGKAAKNVTETEALDYVLGYVCCNDVSARTQQLDPKISGSQWVRGKSFDSFAPFGPVLTYRHAIEDPNQLHLEFKLNDDVLQSENTSDMIFSCKHIISYLSQSTTLLPGTLIMTGTPKGVGFARKPPVFMKPGDVAQVSIEKLGKLRNTVVNE